MILFNSCVCKRLLSFEWEKMITLTQEDITFMNTTR
uniref:Uncharacterized protein n=1 Tax=Anopheles albimanus TaxID=7167 RepID=A0A182FZ49_ANOAL